MQVKYLQMEPLIKHLIRSEYVVFSSENTPIKANRNFAWVRTK